MLGMMIALVAVLFVAVPVVVAVLVGLAVLAASLVKVLDASAVDPGSGLIPGIVLGFLLVRSVRKNRKAVKAE